MNIFKKLKQSLVDLSRSLTGTPKRKKKKKSSKSSKIKKKSLSRKVVTKKSVAKTPLKKKISKVKKVAVKSKKQKISKPIAPKAKPIPGVKIGVVTHYFPNVNAAVIKLQKGVLRLGDSIYIKGHTTELKQKVDSIQIDRKPLKLAKAGDEIGLEVRDRVREEDEVYKLKS